MIDDELLEQIRAKPHDDDPRSVYADVLLERGDERGEYIQLALHRANNHWDDQMSTRWDELKQREKTWAAELGIGGIEGVGWFRGLPNYLTSTVELVVQHADALNRLPIERMTFWHSVRDLASLAALPALATVHDL